MVDQSAVDSLLGTAAEQAGGSIDEMRRFITAAIAVGAVVDAGYFFVQGPVNGQNLHGFERWVEACPILTSRYQLKPVVLWGRLGGYDAELALISSDATEIEFEERSKGLIGHGMAIVFSEQGYEGQAYCEVVLPGVSNTDDSYFESLEDLLLFLGDPV